MMGVGLATAILIDATIVRAVLLPASMKLLGRWNWYLPQAPRVAPAHRARAHHPGPVPRDRVTHPQRTVRLRRAVRVHPQGVGSFTRNQLRVFEPTPSWVAIGELATAQWGVVAGGQLRARGVSQDVIERWARTGRLHRMYRGVYAVGHTALRREAHWMAAVLACGEGAVLSHTSAAALWAIRRTAATRVHVSAPRGRHGHPGIALHRPRRLHRDDVTEKDGIATTTPERTLRDLAVVLSPDGFERAVARAEQARLVEAGAFMPEAKLTESEAERLLLELVRSAGLPEPAVNVWLPVGEIKVDFLWRAHGVVVEIDGFATHGTRRAFETDRARDQALAAAGYRTLRFTYRQLTAHASAVQRTLHRVLGPSCSSAR